MKLATLSLAFLLTASAQEPQQPVRVSSGVMAGQLIHKVSPHYPREAYEAHVSGSVVLHIIIGEDGHVHDITVVSGPQMLRKAYVDAVSQWVYKPYRLNGRAVPVEITITINIQHGSLEPPPLQRVQLSSGVLAGLNLTHPTPAYPRYSKEDHISGATVIHVSIGKGGHVLETRLISGPPARTPYELEAVKQWTYKPYLLNGEPAEVESVVTLQPNFGG